MSLTSDVDVAKSTPAVLCAVSFHYVRSRRSYLREVLATIAHYPIDTALHVFTNASREVAKADINSIIQNAGLKLNENAFVHSVEVKGSPFGLTWGHKPLITSEFLSSSHWTHFVYLEDDERLTYENFRYFTDMREKLRTHGLLPGFLRTEWSARLNTLVNTDNVQSMRLDERAGIDIDGYRFVNADNPYHGAYILDQELAREYVTSASFDREKSATVTNCGLAERAAMGLLFERVPVSFGVRAVVPVSQDTMQVPDFACIAHLPNNYAGNSASPLGKVKMADLFLGKPSVTHGPWYWRVRRATRLFTPAWWLRKGRRVKERIWPA